MTQAQLDVWNEAVGRAEEDPTDANRAFVEDLKQMHISAVYLERRQG